MVEDKNIWFAATMGIFVNIGVRDATKKKDSIRPIPANFVNKITSFYFSIERCYYNKGKNH
jgi:hypothetical protein